MEKHFLDDFVAELGLNESDRRTDEMPLPWYNPPGDCVMYIVANEAILAERIDEFLTLYRSAQDGRVIGFVIKEVLALIKEFGYDGLRVSATVDDDEIVSVRALLFAAFEKSAKTVRVRQGYASAIQPPYEADKVAVPHQVAA